MHPKLLESTVAQCRAYLEAGDCHGEAPPTERLIDAVAQLTTDLAYYKNISERYTERLLRTQPSEPEALSLTLSANDAKFLAARLRRLFAQFNFPLPDGARDDTRLIGLAGSAIGLMLTNAEQPVAWVNGDELRNKANATIACGPERREVAGHAYDTPLYAVTQGRLGDAEPQVFDCTWPACGCDPDGIDSPACRADHASERATQQHQWRADRVTGKAE